MSKKAQPVEKFYENLSLSQTNANCREARVQAPEEQGFAVAPLPLELRGTRRRFQGSGESGQRSRDRRVSQTRAGATPQRGRKEAPAAVAKVLTRRHRNHGGRWRALARRYGGRGSLLSSPGRLSPRSPFCGYSGKHPASFTQGNNGGGFGTGSAVGEGGEGRGRVGQGERRWVPAGAGGVYWVPPPPHPASLALAGRRAQAGSRICCCP